jgi:hypothetical protein
MGPPADARSRGETEPSRRAVVMGGLAAAAFPGSAGAAADDVSPVMRKLSAYSARCRMS